VDLTNLLGRGSSFSATPAAAAASASATPAAAASSVVPSSVLAASPSPSNLYFFF